MKQRFAKRRLLPGLFTAVVLLNVALGLLTLNFVQADTVTPRRERPARVVVISLDGARPDALLMAETPNLQALAARGAYTWTASTTFPPVTIPAHSSILTGLDTSEQGVTWNEYRAEPIDTPTFLSLAADVGYTTAMVVGKEKFEQFRQRDSMQYVFARQGDRSVVDQAVAWIEGGVEVMFVHFPNPDYFGHSTGWMSDTYLEMLYTTDQQIGRIIEALEAEGVFEDTLLIITADHGGHELVHGSDIPEDMLVPFLITGPGVEAGLELRQAVTNTDAAMTVLWALGLPLPESEIGRPVLEAFGRGS
ncbi:MAG: alkaline phosphatase family protein [bacterium]|nr:alkaline phosphatase family protein [bacterium]